MRTTSSRVGSDSGRIVALSVSNRIPYSRARPPAARSFRSSPDTEPDQCGHPPTSEVTRVPFQVPDTALPLSVSRHQAPWKLLPSGANTNTAGPRACPSTQVSFMTRPSTEPSNTPSLYS